MPYGACKKRPPKKNNKKIKKVFCCCCCRTCSGRTRTWGKLDLEKDRDRKKTEKRQKEVLYTTQMAHLYSGSMIIRTSNCSNGNNNNSNFGGSGLAGPPVINPHQFSFRHKQRKKVLLYCVSYLAATARGDAPPSPLASRSAPLLNSKSSSSIPLSLAAAA